MIPKLATFFVFLTLLSSSAPAQDKLYLEKPGKLKRLEIKPGETVRFLLTGDQFKYTGTFTRAHDEWIHFGQDSLRTDELAALFLRGRGQGHHWLKMTQRALSMGALAFAAMILLNRTAVNGANAADFRLIGLVSGSALTLSALLNVFQWRRFHLEKGKWRLQMRTPIEHL